MSIRCERVSVGNRIYGLEKAVVPVDTNRIFGFRIKLECSSNSFLFACLIYEYFLVFVCDAQKYRIPWHVSVMCYRHLHMVTRPFGLESCLHNI